jgi:hypothetical protein
MSPRPLSQIRLDQDKTWFQWLFPVFNASEEEIHHACGEDAIFYLKSSSLSLSSCSRWSSFCQSISQAEKTKRIRKDFFQQRSAREEPNNSSSSNYPDHRQLHPGLHHRIFVLQEPKKIKVKHPTRTVMIRGLPESTNTDDLKTHFSELGASVLEVVYHKDCNQVMKIAEERESA